MCAEIEKKKNKNKTNQTKAINSLSELQCLPMPTRYVNIT